MVCWVWKLHALVRRLLLPQQRMGGREACGSKSTKIFAKRRLSFFDAYPWILPWTGASFVLKGISDI
jgi:hypothetical protein